MRQILEYQADQIEYVLHAHNIAGRVRGGIVTPGWVRFDTVLPATTTPEKVVRLQGAIGHRLGCECLITTRDGHLVIEVARRERANVTLSQIIDKLPQAPPLSALLGIGLRDGRPLLLRIASPDVAHILVSGTTGCGKTALMRAVVASLAWHNETGIHLYIIDPTGRGYNDLAWLPHLPLHAVISDIEDATDVIQMLVTRMDRHEEDTRALIVIDELADLILAGGQPILEGLTRLTQRGRGAGLHVLAGTQKPTASAIGSLVKSNFPTRIVGRVLSAEDAKVASGRPGTGAEKLRGRGDFLLVLGDCIRFQAALADAEFLHRLRRRIRRGGYAGESDGDPLAEYRAHVKAGLRVLPGGLQIEADARYILKIPGWIDEWWDSENRSFHWGYLTRIAEALGRENAGAGHRYIKQVSDELEKLLTLTSPAQKGKQDYDH